MPDSQQGRRLGTYSCLSTLLQLFVSGRGIDANELNNIEWKGSGCLTGKAVRKFEIKTGWGKWTDHESGLSPQPDFNVEKKKNGEWTVSAIKYVPPYIENPIKSMTCEEIKRMVKQK